MLSLTFIYLENDHTSGPRLVVSEAGTFILILWFVIVQNACMQNTYICMFDNYGIVQVCMLGKCRCVSQSWRCDAECMPWIIMILKL